MLLQNLRVGIRGFRRAPAFAATAVLTLALGIGLSTAVFTIADALLFRPLPVTDQDRLVVLTGSSRNGATRDYPLGVEEARQFLGSASTLSRTATFAYEGAAAKPVRDGAELTRLRRALVSGDFFTTLGTTPLLGRALQPEDDVFGAVPVMVLSHRAWRERFGGAAEVLGRQVVMHDNGVAYTIVGVMPKGLDYPRGTDVWAAIRAATPEANLRFVAVHGLGRLAPGATPERAAGELTAFFGRDGAPAWQSEMRGVARTLPEVIVGDVRTAVLVFAAASGLLLLITCINVANLLLTRGLARAEEMAVRAALGAARGRIVAQLLSEHALLALAGGILGLLIAFAAVRGFVALAPAGLPRLDEIRVDTTALLATIAIASLAMALFGLAPALMTSRVELARALRSGARQGLGRRSRLVADALVVGQVALAFIVLSVAALLARSFVELERTELAFEPAPLVVGELALRYDIYDTPDRQRAVLEQLMPKVKALPGVQGVTPVVAVPFSGSHGWDGRFAAEGQAPDEAAASPMLNMEVVAPEYFATFGLPVLLGRSFSEDDRQGAPPVVMVSERTARHYWPDDDPIGRRLTLGPPTAQHAFTVVGVVPDTRYRELRDARASIYFPLEQSFFPFTPTTLVIRTTTGAAVLAPALRRVVEETAPGVAIASVAPLESFLDRPLAQPRLNALLLAVFATASVALAAVGLFGVMAAMVRQRTRELGVRMALGASTSTIGRMILGRGLLLAGAGTALGLAGALVTNRLVAGMLFEVRPSDVPTLVTVSVMLLVVAALSAAVPARWSTRIEPAVALRAD